MSLLKPLALVAVVIFLVLTLFRSVEDEIDIQREIDIEETTQLGVLASSLNNPARPAAPVRRSATPQPEPETTRAASAAVEEAERELQRFNQIEAALTLAEYVTADLVNERTGTLATWKAVSSPAPAASLFTEDFRVRLGNNHFEYQDGFVRYDFSMDIEEITEETVKGQITIRRVLQTQPPRPNSISASGTFKITDGIVIVDRLPRMRLLELPNSALSTIYGSQAFLSGTTELVQIIKFANPTNSPED